MGAEVISAPVFLDGSSWIAKSYVYVKTVKNSRDVRGAKAAQLKLEINEVVYGDGTVWRLTDAGKTD